MSEVLLYFSLGLHSTLNDVICEEKHISHVHMMLNFRLDINIIVLCFTLSICHLELTKEQFAYLQWLLLRNLNVRVVRLTRALLRHKVELRCSGLFSDVLPN